MEVAYYTCLNDQCLNYRAIFVEGAPEHAQCKQTRLFPQQASSKPATWPLVAAGVLAVAGAGVAVAYTRRSRPQPNRAPLGERQVETWSPGQRVVDERRGYEVPPPITRDTVS